MNRTIKMLVLPILLNLSSFDLYADNSIDIVRDRIVPDLSRQELDRFLEADTSFDTVVDGLINSMNSDGTWNDIDYEYQANADELIKHGERMLLIAVAAYENRHPDAMNAILTTLTFWASENRENNSWWWNDIGIPRLLGPILLMVGEQVSDDILNRIVQYMPDVPTQTGANKSDISTSVIYKGLLSYDEELITRGVNGLLDVITITNNEGIQSDYSFHQHGKQLYSGGYGETFIKSLSFWAYHMRELKWSFPNDKQRIISDYFLDGVRWMNRNGVLDYNVEGRGITRPASLNNPLLSRQAEYIEAIEYDRIDEATAFRQHLEGGVSDINGFKVFWRSDYATKLADNHFIGIRMNSNRTEPNEYGNGENKLGLWLGFGSMFLMQGGDEYHGIFPVWDWKFVPGVTAPVVTGRPATWGAIMQSTSFTGGVTDGVNGIAVFDMDYYNTQARKAWFSFKDELVAIGAGISSQRSEHINTTINQTLLKGPVTVDGIIYDNGARQLVDASWVHHNSIGYIFPESWYGQMSNNTHNGNWNRINSKYSADPISKDVFTLRIGHGISPSNSNYQYIILPNSDTNQTAEYASNSPIEVISNTPILQAVRHNKQQITGIVFYEPGSLTLNDGTRLSVNHPSTLLFDENTGKIALSTPGVAGAHVTISVVSPRFQTQSFTVTTPENTEELGKSIHLELSSQSIVALEDAYVRGGTNSDNNYGNLDYLIVKNDGPSYDRKALLKFDLTNVDISTISLAELTLKVRTTNTDSSRDITVSSLMDDSWTQNTVTWSSVPGTYKTGITKQLSSDQLGDWVTFNVTELLVDETDSTFSLMLENKGFESGRSDMSFFSSESEFQPKLILYP